MPYLSSSSAVGAKVSLGLVFAVVWNRFVKTAVALVIASSPAAHAAAYEFEDPVNLDHRDQWGVRLDLGATLLAAASVRGGGGSSVVAMLELGVSRGLPYTGHELSVRLRPLLGDGFVGAKILSGYRVYAGMEHWKTFADIDLVVPLSPGPAAGARLGLGAMYDPNRRFGFSLSGGAFAAVGGRVISGFDLSLGAQLRFD